MSSEAAQVNKTWRFIEPPITNTHTTLFKFSTILLTGLQGTVTTMAV